MARRGTLKNQRWLTPENLAYLFLALVAVYFTIRQGIVEVRPPGLIPTDFSVYYRAAGRLNAGEPVYLAADSSPFKYSPAFLILFRYSFFLFPKTVAYGLWCALSNLCLTLAFLLFFRKFLPSSYRESYLFPGSLAVATVLSWRGYFEQLCYGQADFFIASAYLIGCVCWNDTRRWVRRLAPVLGGLMLITKPPSAILLSSYFLEGAYSLLVLTGVATAVLLFLPILVTGPLGLVRMFQSWFQCLRDQQDAVFMTGNLNQSLSAALARLTGHIHAVGVLQTLFLAGFVAVLFAYKTVNKKTSRQRDKTFGAGSAATVVFSLASYLVFTPLSWRWLAFLWIPISQFLISCLFITGPRKWGPAENVYLSSLSLFFLLGLGIQKMIVSHLGVAEVDILSYYSLYAWINLALFSGSLASLTVHICDSRRKPI